MSMIHTRYTKKIYNEEITMWPAMPASNTKGMVSA